MVVQLPGAVMGDPGKGGVRARRAAREAPRDERKRAEVPPGSNEDSP